MNPKTTTQVPNRLGLIRVILLGVMVASMTNCMSVPEGSSAMKQRALSFTPPPGKAGVYAIRPYRYTGSAVLFNVSLNYREFGSLETNSYLFGIVSPGEHAVRIPGTGAQGVFSAVAGRNYFFTVKPGFLAPQIDQISEADGQAYVRRFKLSGDNRFEYQD